MERNTLTAMTPEEVHNYLEHHGIKGMRWGIRRTPEELGHKLKARNARHYGHYNKAVAKIGKIQGDKTVNQLTTKEKEKMVKAVEKAQSYLKKMASDEKKYGKKIAKAEARETEEKEKAAAKEAAKSAEDQKFKEKLLKKQKWEDIYKNKELFTTQELSDVATRINAEKKVQEALETNHMDKLAKKVTSAANLVGSGVNLYNKFKDVQNIFESGQRERAYKEIRQLMAEGNNAEVVKRSVGIADKDVELFEKRRKFLSEINKNLGVTTKNTSGSTKTDSTKTSQTKSGTIKKEKSLLDSVLDKTVYRNKNTVGDDVFNKQATDLLGQFNKSMDSSIKKKSKEHIEILKSWADSSASYDVKTDPVIKIDKNFIFDRPLSEVKLNTNNPKNSALEQLVINDVGDFYLRDLIPTY